LRIGLLIYGALSQRSGGYLYDRKLVAHLRRRGHQVRVVSIPWRGYYRSLLDNFSPSLFRRLQSLPVDLLIQDELNHPSLFLLNTRLKRAVSYPIVSIVHLLRFTIAPRWISWLYRAIEARYLRSLDGFIFNSRDTQRWVRKLVPRRKPAVLATPGGDRFRSRITPAAIRRRAAAAGPLRVLFLGNIVERKAPHVLLQAAATLGDDVRVSLAGRTDMEPAYVRKLRDLAGSNVSFLGHVDGARLERLLRESHVLALPSSYEGFGIAYLEGFAFGLPAIGTRAGAACELVTHGRNGFLIQPGDSAALARHLAALHADRRLLERMSVAALQAHRTFPTWEQSLGRIEVFLSSYNQPTKRRQR
jgi:glycosyltransferase involved in cell wall biosynthesis